MVYEAVLKVRLADPIDFTVADGTGIEKGTILKMTEPRTVAASSGASDVFGGIAAREKIADDGRTRLAVYRRGIFDLEISGGTALSAGQWVTISGVNLLRICTEAELVAGKGVGILLEDTGADAPETAEVLVGGY